MIVATTANNILKAMFGMSQNATIASTCYIGLSTTTPTASGDNFSEPASEYGYSRSLLGVYNTTVSQVMDQPVNGVIKNGTNIILFPEATTGWGTVTHFGLFTSEKGGSPFFWGALTTGVTIPTGYIPIFRANALSVTLT